MKITPQFASLFLLGIAALTGRPAHAAAVTIANYNFELPNLGCSNCGTTLGDVSGWNATGWAQVASGVVVPADGTQDLQIGAGAPGHIDQTLAINLLANTTYTLSYYVGSRFDGSAGDYTLALEANNVVLQSTSDPYTGAPGAMEQKSFTYTSGASVTAGQALQISLDLAGAGGVGVFDLFALDAVTQSTDPAVPEPGTLALSVSAIALLGWFRRRRASAL